MRYAVDKNCSCFARLSPDKNYGAGRSVVRIPVETRFYSLLPNAQAASGAHPSSYSMGIEVLYPGGYKAAGA